MSLLKKLLPDCLFQWLKQKKYEKSIIIENKYQKKRLLRYSNVFKDDEQSNLTSLLIISHVLEKGITMPDRRPGFGYDRVRDLIFRCKDIISRFGYGSIELQSAIADLKQYKDIHRDSNFILPEDIDKGIDEMVQYLSFEDGNCWITTKENYFKATRGFKEFAESRHSVRWFDESEVDEEKLMAAIKLAQTAPSACNRQATRVKIISTPEGKKLCCDLQNGNRGFGYKADKWLLITSELSAWSQNYPFDPYVDGGIFAMNLLYALHYYGIVACTLNAHLTPEQRDMLQKELGYPESEVPVVFIIIGNPVDSFMVPKSRRLKVSDIVQKA